MIFGWTTEWRRQRPEDDLPTYQVIFSWTPEWQRQRPDDAGCGTGGCLCGYVVNNSVLLRILIILLLTLPLRIPTPASRASSAGVTNTDMKPNQLYHALWTGTGLTRTSNGKIYMMEQKLFFNGQLASLADKVEGVSSQPSVATPRPHDATVA
eukprot:g35460.t1